MRERPILFQGAMVRALLAGTKTQTRRLVKPQPHNAEEVQGAMRHPGVAMFGALATMAVGDEWACPYGKPGDRLWVREAWRAPIEFNAVPPRDIPPGTRILYEAEGRQGRFHRGKLRPSMFMPRWACRLVLEVTEVRVERLQDISETDAIAEGCITEDVVSGYDGSTIKVPAEIPHPSGKGSVGWDCARDWYADLWESINGAGSWDANPWVWAVSFRRVDA